MSSTLKRTARLGVVMTILATALLVAGATPALADTSQATARAAQLTLLGGTVVDTGVVTATNDGTIPDPGTVTGNTNPSLAVLGAQTLLTAGVLVQQAVANQDGTSAACAGLVGPGGNIQIGPAGNCLVTGTPAPGGVVIDLGNLVTVQADAILAECMAASNGPNGPGSTTAGVQLVNAVVKLAGITVVTLPVNAAPSTSPVGVPGVISLLLNDQDVPLAGPGVSTTGTSALDLQVLGTVVHVNLGRVTCGPNTIAPVVPAFPLSGLPVALATLAAAGGVAVLVHRRRRGAATTA